MQILDENELVSSISALPASHNMRILFRFSYLPIDLDFIKLYVNDKSAFDYLYCQCLADFNRDAIFKQINHEISLALASLRLQQLHLMIGNNSSENLSSNHSNSKLSTKDSKRRFFSVRSSILSNLNVNSIATAATNANNGITSTNKYQYEVTADHVLNNSKKIIKQMINSYGLNAFTPKYLSDRMKEKQLIKILDYYFKDNQYKIIPLIADHLNETLKNYSQSNDSNSSSSSSSSINSSPLLTRLSLINKKSFDLKKVRINEDLIKLCFLTLYSEIPWFGVHAFSLKNSLDDFNASEILNPIEKSLLERIDDDGMTNCKNLMKQFNKIEIQVWLSPKIGICQVIRNSTTIKTNPYVLAKLDDVIGIRVTRYEECYLNVEIKLKMESGNLRLEYLF